MLYYKQVVSDWRTNPMEEFASRKVKTVFGEKYDLISMQRILGGAQKHTYLARCTNGFCFVIYFWDKSTTFFSNETEVFCSSSAVLFEKNNELMKKHGVLTPEMYYMDRSRSEWNFEYAFIHSELGPNHVMVDKDNNAYLIDIEGAGYRDVEEENSFLQFRFDNRITGMKDDIDDKRMQFYHIGHCFGNLSGAIELKKKGYYDMDDVNGMIDFFHGQFQVV